MHMGMLSGINQVIAQGIYFFAKPVVTFGVLQQIPE